MDATLGEDLDDVLFVHHPGDVGDEDLCEGAAAVFECSLTPDRVFDRISESRSEFVRKSDSSVIR